MSDKTSVFLDDLAIGQEYQSQQYQLDKEQIISFAKQFDPQPFHTDEAAAEHSFFQGLAASGWHTAAITMKLLVGSLPIGNGLIGAGVDVQWPRPTRPNDTLRVVSKIIEITPSRSKPDRGIVTVECRTLNQNDDVCQKMLTKIVVMRRP
ncbi:MaoC family dehydratase [Microvirga sp. W0021]|uniref:MaoC family dehydratase n=1 Tax=Hohaiivirga grylli TaxID=3133970 RepID=A0ABV0BFA8_9HYPH